MLVHLVKGQNLLVRFKRFNVLSLRAYNGTMLEYWCNFQYWCIWFKTTAYLVR